MDGKINCKAAFSGCVRKAIRKKRDKYLSGVLDCYDALSADIVYQRILDGKEKVYSSKEARKILGLDD